MAEENKKKRKKKVIDPWILMLFLLFYNSLGAKNEFQ